MSEVENLLVEIGTEELPPKALKRLSIAFGELLCERLTAQGLEYSSYSVYATPRRLAVTVNGLPISQPDRDIERRGPSVEQSFDEAGKPTKAAEGFANSVGLKVEQLERLENNQGSWLLFRTTEVGEATASLLPSIVEEALAKLPIAKRMRWSDLDVEFVRPVHWIVLLFGTDIVKARILGVDTGRISYGHRFHHPEGMPLEDAASYATTLYSSGRVVVDFAARAQMIREQVEEAATVLGGEAVMDANLIEETTALVEWPVAVAGSFDPEFLSLPESVLMATLKGHQRYFPVRSKDGKLLPHFITISNIESRTPDVVRAGNERVIRPRLSDAAFFHAADADVSLEDRQAGLSDLVFHKKLGSMFDKAERVANLAGHVAIAIGESPEAVKLARRAGQLSKCDLLTQMVTEFPELQGQMGMEYARSSGEAESVALAIGEAYMPRFAGDRIPSSATGRAVAIADKLDTLVGIFGIGQAPSGDKDPYALRRAALGCLRIFIEGELALGLPKLLQAATVGYKDLFEPGDTVQQTLDFMLDRLRAYFIDQEIPVEVFLAVQARHPEQPYDFARRVRAVDEFRRRPEANSLSAANKRIHNILKQAGDSVAIKADDALFSEDAEWNLAAMLVALGPRVKDMLKKGDYTGALSTLAGLRDNIDAFFDNVKVMDDNTNVKNNRIALLREIYQLFLKTADISRLQG